MRNQKVYTRKNDRGQCSAVCSEFKIGCSRNSSSNHNNNDTKNSEALTVIITIARIFIKFGSILIFYLCQTRSGSVSLAAGIVQRHH